MRTVCGSEFQEDGAENWKSVLMNRWSSSGTADERKVRLQVRSTIRQCRTRSSADADNRLDAFSGQSRSTNMVPTRDSYI